MDLSGAARWQASIAAWMAGVLRVWLSPTAPWSRMEQTTPVSGASTAASGGEKASAVWRSATCIGDIRCSIGDTPARRARPTEPTPSGLEAPFLWRRNWLLSLSSSGLTLSDSECDAVPAATLPLSARLGGEAGGGYQKAKRRNVRPCWPSYGPVGTAGSALILFPFSHYT